MIKDSTRQKIESSQEDILSYYQDHCLRVTASHFHVSPMALENWLTEKGLLKSPTLSAGELVSKEQLVDLYLNQNKSKQEVATQLGLTIWTLSKLFENYDIHKDIANVVALRQNTCMERYGVDNPRKAEEIKSKIKATNLEKYGAVTFTASEAGKQQVADTKTWRYGDAEYNNIQQGMATKEIKYGDSHYNNRDKNKETCLSKYGVAHGGLLPQTKARSREAACERANYSDLYKQIFDNREEAIKFLSAQNYTLIDLMPIFNAPYKQIQQWITRWDLRDYINWVGGRSQYEDQIVVYLKSLNINNIETHNRTICKGSELDIYLPDYKVGIEFNGDYWHSSEKRPPNYHYNKSKICEQQGIRLIHIYQHQWEDITKQNILKSIIRNAVNKNSNIVYARKCELRELNKRDVDLFSQQNSLHGHRNASVYLGLFYEGELIELMSFGKAFFSRDPSIDFECIRSITKINTTVVGGMNKLFKYFISKWKPHKILYYVDYNTHNGNSMSKLGFEFQSYSKHGILNVATCKEVEDKFGAVFNRKPERNAEIQQYIQEGKVLSIYDAGVKKYIWTAPQQ